MPGGEQRAYVELASPHITFITMINGQMVARKPPPHG